MKYQPFQQRVVDENSDLDTKISALTAFLEVPFFNSLPSAEQARLRLQLQHMTCYSEVLGERIAAFPEQ
jgi:hypothetical protein